MTSARGDNIMLLSIPQPSAPEPAATPEDLARLARRAAQMAASLYIRRRIWSNRLKALTLRLNGGKPFSVAAQPMPLAQMVHELGRLMTGLWLAELYQELHSLRPLYRELYALLDDTDATEADCDLLSAAYCN